MTWLQRYRIRHYLQNSMWIYPVLAMVVAMVMARLSYWLDMAMDWRSNSQSDTVQAVLSNLAGAMFTFIVFICSSLLLVVQMASAQLTPRIIGVMFKDSVTKLTLSTFVFSFAFTTSTLVRIGDTVPLVTTRIAGYSSAVCLALFLFLVDRVSKALRPSGALRSVAVEAHQVIDNVYPRRLQDPPQELPKGFGGARTEPVRTINCQTDGVALAFDVQGLVGLAIKHDCLIELAPQVGEYVAPGDPLFRIHGGSDIPATVLHQSIALGAERTMEQDPSFAFRVIVDVASKALSPAINDPTTAVLAIDQLHHLLRHVGRRRLDNEKVRDTAGRVRLIYRTPDWEDYIALAVTEIRQFGEESIQIARRLRAMLEDLVQTLPEERAVPLRQELRVLQQSNERLFMEPEDRALAAISDSQGMGGRHVPRRVTVESPPVRSPIPSTLTDPHI